MKFPALLILALSSTLWASSSLAQESVPAGRDAYPLVAAVPADAFLVTAARHNPERAFLDAHWARVGNAFEQSGVLDELIGLVLSEAGEEASAEMTRLFDELCGHCEAVDWSALGRDEFVFAERMPGPIWIGSEAMTLIPDMVFLFRADAETSAAAHEALLAVFETAFDEIYESTGTRLTLVRGQREDAAWFALELGMFLPDAPEFALTIGSHGDVLFATVGEGIRDEVLGLLTGSSGAASFADKPRFRSALAALPDAEDGFEFVDVNTLAASLESLTDEMLDHFGEQMGESEPGLDMGRAIASRMTRAVGVVDWVATTHRTEGHSVYSDSLTILAEDAASNPIYPVLASGGSIDDFATYLPVETTSFSVSGGVDMGAIYTFFEDTIRAGGDLGEEALANWEGFQEEVGVDVREDVIGWIDGAGVSASFTTELGDAWVLMMKVRDEERARSAMNAVLGRAPAFVERAVAENPMIAMLGLTVTPTGNEELPGFHDISTALTPVPMTMGVVDGWMILGSSADAVLVTRATAAGEHPNVRENERVMSRGLTPEGAAGAVSFTDHSQDAALMSGVLSGVAMTGGFATAQIPDEDAKRVAETLFRIVGRLAPVVGTIDFFESSSSVTTATEGGWRTRSVVHYVAPPAEEGR